MRILKSVAAVALTLLMLLSGMTFSSGDSTAVLSPRYEISGAVTVPGGTFEIEVLIADNPGIISLRNEIDFDAGVFDLVNVENTGLLNGYTTPSPEVRVPFTLRWADSLAVTNNTDNGAVAKLTFKAKDDAPVGDYIFCVNHIEARTVNGTKVAFDTASSTVKVSDTVIGDADGDGEVTDWDAIMFERYLAGWDVVICLGSLDIDGDGEVTDWDAILLSRYLAGWEVQFATPEPVETPIPNVLKNETSLAASVSYASDMLNGIQGYYDSPDRAGFTVENLNSRSHITLKGGVDRGLTSIANPEGVPYVNGGITGYVKANDGSVFLTSTSSSSRVNTNKMGAYYYEVNIRDLNFESSVGDDAVYEQGSSINPQRVTRSSNDLSNISVTSSSVSFTIQSNYDPYLVLSFSQYLNGCDTVVFDITSNGTATSGDLFYVYDAGTSYSESQKRVFKFEEGCTKQRIYVYVPAFEGYTGRVRGIRFDINGATEGDRITIENISLMKAPDVPAVKYGFEQSLHAYSDKLHSELRILYDIDFDDITEFGGKYVIPANTVAGITVGLKNGNVLSEINGVTEDFEYIGFDIANAGVFGLIAENDGVTHTRVYPDGANYVVEFYLDVSGSHVGGTDDSFGHRIYTDTGHSFSDLAKEAYYERHPLTFEVTSQYYRLSKLTAVGYDTKTGAYSLTLAGTDFVTAYKPVYNNRYYGGTIKVNASDSDRKVYFLTDATNTGCIESAAILDDNQLLAPIQPEVCKNFSGEIEEPYYDSGDILFSVTVFPLVVEARKDLTYTVLNLYQNWGNHPLKQVSSISFHIGYYHLSTGVTESNCIAPYFVYGRDGWTLPDFRGCSGIMWSGQPQFNSVGRLKFLSYKDSSGKVYQSEYTGSEILSVGPVYSDLKYSYLSYDGSIAYSLRHVEFPSTDENRTFYVLEGEVLKDVTIANARSNFTLFYFDPRYQCMKNLRYKSIDGSTVSLSYSTTSANSEKTYKLAKENPWFSLYNFSLDSGSDVENFGFLVKSFEMTVGGNAFNGGLVLRHSIFKDGIYMNKAEIGVDADTLAFKKGDTIKFVFILLPFGTYDQTDDHNVTYVYEDSILNPWRISAVTKGSVVYDDYLAIVKCEDNEAQFTVTGGRNANAVKVTGFTELSRPRVQEYVEGRWVDYVYNFADFDGYQVNYSDEGLIDYSFIIDMENYTDERIFRVIAE